MKQQRLGLSLGLGQWAPDTFWSQRESNRRNREQGQEAPLFVSRIPSTLAFCRMISSTDPERQ